MPIRDLFLSDVTRDIPPVVYFHEQSPERLAAEVSEYIITGGWPEEHPNHRRVPDGIHEQYVHLLNNIAAELEKPDGPDLPNVWISGFYGSGKSSFAKLLGLALDGVALPDGSSLADAWLQRDTSPRREELRTAWDRLRRQIDPLAVVFDIGSVARDNEHIHAAAVRQLQRRLGYCSDALVANFELALERDGAWRRFEQTAQHVLGQPWSVVKDRALAEEDFSHVMSVLYPDRYTDPMSWYTSRGGTQRRAESPEEAAKAIHDMLHYRRPGATLFLVIDEVLQYVLSSEDRVDRLRAFATALGSSLRGRVWLLALGQQKIDEEAGTSFLSWAKDRFLPRLRVHLAPTNIRDVVHRRLLQKKPAVEPRLRAMFERYRPELKLYAYNGETVTTDEFVEVYPMLPGQIDLILQITSALRSRSSRAQGDDQAIRGLLQLLGELFRGQRLADKPEGYLVTLDQIYEVQHTALNSETQETMARILTQCSDDTNVLLVRAAKAVALLELIQDLLPTSAKLVAQALFDRVDRGDMLAEVTAALEELRRRNLLGYSEKQGYKIQSSAGEEWERERRDIAVPREEMSELVQEALRHLIAEPERPRLQGRPFPWVASYSDGRRANDVTLQDARDDAFMHVDFRFLTQGERAEHTWVRRSAEAALANRLIWLAGDSDRVEELVRELHRSRRMVGKYNVRRESLTSARRLLLQHEEIRVEDLEREVRQATAEAWLAGSFYFRGRQINPRDFGASFASALQAAAERLLPDLFPHIISTQLVSAELLQLVAAELSGPSPKFLLAELGILELDGGRYIPTCSGVVPHRVRAYIETERGVSGSALLAHFGAPPYGYTANVVKACVAGLLRDTRLRLQPEAGTEITAIRDAGVRELFDRERAFRSAMILPVGAGDISPQDRARICRFFADRLQHSMEREDHAIADAVSLHFPPLLGKLREVRTNLNRLPGSPNEPENLRRLGEVLENGIRLARQTRPTVDLVKHNLDLLNDSVPTLQQYTAELTPQTVTALREAQQVLDYNAGQLSTHEVNGEIQDAAERIRQLLAQDRPWRELTSISGDLDRIRLAYKSERQRLLRWQEEQVEAARVRIRARDGFTTLTSSDVHSVFSPLASAATDTTAEASSPPLADLGDPFLLRLRRAEERAHQTLDTILSRRINIALITPMDLASRLRNRELTSAADVDALVNEIRTTLMTQIEAGMRVRLQ